MHSSRSAYTVEAADLDLTKAKKMILQTEAVQKTQKLSAGDSRENPIEVDALQGTRSRRGDSRGGY